MSSLGLALKNSIYKYKNGRGYTRDTSDSIMNDFVSTLSTYLVSNTRVSISFKGTKPNGKPDIFDESDVKIIGSCATTGRAKDFNSWLAKLSNNIQIGFNISTGTKTIPSSNNIKIFTITNLSETIKQSDLRDLGDKVGIENKVWNYIGNGITKHLITRPSIELKYPATTITGSTGICTVTKITIN